MTTWLLKDVEDAVQAGWAADTCSPDDLERAPWSAANPAWGHCDITTLVVNDLLGGELVVGEVSMGGEQHGYHWWNRLPGGIEIDLTRSQFRAGQAVSKGRTVPRPAGRPPRRQAEYERLRSRVLAKLGAASGQAAPEPLRAAFDIAGRQLSYLDFGGTGQVVLALHGHFNEARTFADLAGRLAPDWRVIALDQRGHGYSDRPADFSREGYVADALGLLDHLGVERAVVLGHSLGGLNAYQLAARHPERVRALVVEDIGAEIADDLSFCLSWPRRAPSYRALAEALGGSMRYLSDAVREYPDGWGLAFRPEDMVASMEQVNGDHWADWLDADCPALLVHGTESTTLGSGQAAAMQARRPGTRLVELPTGHLVHQSDPAGFAGAVLEFLTGCL